MATILVLLFLMLIYNMTSAEFYRIVSFDDTNQTNLQNNICYMTNTEHENNHWCKLVTSDLPILKTCVSINGSLPMLNDVTEISEWIDQSITTTNCSYFLLSSINESQKRTLTIAQLIILLLLFLPFLFQLSLTILHYCFD